MGYNLMHRPVSSIVASNENSPHWRFIGKIIEEMASTQAVDDFQRVDLETKYCFPNENGRMFSQRFPNLRMISPLTIYGEFW